MPEPWLLAFNEFWYLWPYKVNMRQAEATFKKLHAAREVPVTIILKVAIKVQKEMGCLRRLATKDGRDSRPHPSTWLNGKRWLDEVQPVLKETAAAAMGMPESERRDANAVAEADLEELGEEGRAEFLARFKPQQVRVIP